MLKFDRKLFFDAYHAAFGRLSQSQVEGLEFLLRAIEADPCWKRVEEVAYVLSTVHHETAHTFQPIKEYRAKVGTKLRKTQDRYWLSGFYGRGYVMITWEDNYKKFGIAETPDKALEPETAYRILSEGTRKGLFTKRKLGDFINDKDVDYYEARTVVNGHDKALQIADNAEKFERILKASQVSESVVDVVRDEEKIEPEKPEEPPIVEQAKGPPEHEKLKKEDVSLTTKVVSAAAPIGTAIATLGIKIGGVQLSENSIIAICCVFIASIIMGGWLYNNGKNRAHETTKLNQATLADPHKANVVIVK